MGRPLSSVPAPRAATDSGDLSGSVADWFEQARETVSGWLGDGWVTTAAVLVVGLLLLAALARRKRVRRVLRFPLLRRVPPRLRLAVQVEQASGSEPDLEAGFAAQVRSRVRELGARYAHDPRVVYGSDAPVDVPLDALPSQAKFVTALWAWFTKSNTVTLRATLLPASAQGVGCHVVLLEKTGAATPGVRVPEQVLVYRPTPWVFDPQPGSGWSSLQWMPLANLATAWALFAFRSLQAPPIVLDREFGTAFGAAYGEMLAGLEHGDSPDAMRHFRRAIEIDPTFIEAHLNLASALGNSTRARLGRRDLREAERILTATVLPSIPAAALANAGSRDKGVLRWRSLWLRATYSLVMVRFNQLAAALGEGDPGEGDRTRAAHLLEAVQNLDRRVTVAAAVPEGTAVADSSGARAPRGVLAALRRRREERRALQERLAVEGDELVALRRQMAPHVRLMLAGAIDLDAKLKALLTDPPGHAVLPTSLDPEEVPCTCRRRDGGCAEGRGDRHCRRTAVRIIRDIPMTGTPTRIHYTLACTWARDYRERPAEPADERDAALALCVERLDAALEDVSFAQRWPRDPDLAPIRQLLKDGLDDLAAERAAEAALAGVGAAADEGSARATVPGPREVSPAR